MARPRGRARVLRDPRRSTCPPWSRRSPGPKRPQDRIALSDAKPAFRGALGSYTSDAAKSTVDEASEESFPASDSPALSTGNGGGKPAD